MAQAAPFSTMRVAARLANSYALDIIKLGSLGRDVVDSLIVICIVQANVALITRDVDLQRAYATIDQPPPDELRRPVSVSAVANSLRMPFETVRRRIGRMADAGLIETCSKGVIVPQAPLDSPFYRIGLEAHYYLTRSLYYRLRDIGALQDLRPPLPDNPVWTEPPGRLLARISTDYILRLADPLALHLGDLMSGIILMDIVSANTEAFTDEDKGGDAATEEDFIPDERRCPVRVATLAQRLGLPEETVRRHVARVVKGGRAVKVDKGYIVPASVFARGLFVEFMLTNRTQLERMFSTLSELGVVGIWDRERNTP